jgi:hypothetical protein
MGFAVVAREIRWLANQTAVTTRILLVHYTGGDKGSHILGLMGERGKYTLIQQETAFASVGLTTTDASLSQGYNDRHI